MTTPTIKIDTSLGKWGYYGECSLINYTAALPEPSVEPIPDETIATVVATSGKTVNLRVGPSTKRKLVERVPLGSKVTILKDEGVAIPEKGRIRVLIPFMERNGFSDGNGWWYPMPDKQ